MEILKHGKYHLTEEQQKMLDKEVIIKFECDCGCVFKISSRDNLVIAKLTYDESGVKYARTCPECSGFCNVYFKNN